MLILKDKDAQAFKIMFEYIPDKVFQSVYFDAIKDEDTRKIRLSIMDSDVNGSFMLNITTELDEGENMDFDKLSWRIPIGKGLKSMLKMFDTFELTPGKIKGVSGRKSITLASYEDADGAWVTPSDSTEFILNCVSSSDEANYRQLMREKVILSKFTLYPKKIKEFLKYIDVLNVKGEELRFDVTTEVDKSSIIISALDTAGDAFEYPLDLNLAQKVVELDSEERSLDLEDIVIGKSKYKFDNCLLELFKVLKDSDLQEVSGLFSNVAAIIEFYEENVKIILGVVPVN